MRSDDVQVGVLLTRREALALLGVSGAALFTGCTPSPATRREAQGSSLPSCVVRPEQTEGPYFVDERLNRSDIRSDPANGAIKAGALLQLAFNVSRISDDACAPLAGAQVDIWQCDASGVYSDVTDPGFNSIGQKFLRGYQVTDASGLAQFTTIYPGSYEGRTVHIHFKIRTDLSAARGHEFVSQVYFDDALTDRIHALAPYASTGQRTTRNSDDSLFQRGGAQLMLAVAESGQGHAGTFNIGLQLA